MKKIHWVVALTITVSMVMGFSLTASGQGSGKDARMVRVYGSVAEGKLITGLEPDEIWVGRHTTLVWVNMSDVDIKIIFLEGERCKVSTAPAKGMILDSKACYITDYTVPPGGTSSMYFTQVGEFNYDIEYVGKEKTERGKIIVRTEAKGPLGKPAY